MIKSELKWVLYKQKQIQWQFYKFWKSILIPTELSVLSTEQSVLSERHFRTAGSIFKKARGSLEKLSAEGVSQNLGRWICDGWHRLDRGGREEDCRPEQGQRGGAKARPGRNFVGAHRIGDSGH